MTKKEIKKLNKKQLAELLVSMGVTFDSAISKKDMQDLVVANTETEETIELKEVDLDKKTPSKSTPTSEKDDKNKLLKIITKANEINEQFNALKTQEEKEKFVESLNEINGGLGDALRLVFNETFDAPLASDLPNSEIIGTLPLRIMKQILASISISYPLMGLVDHQVVQNGIMDIFYKDYRDADDTSAWSDVVIGDFNMGFEPMFKETFKATTNIHKGYDMLSDKLNDITLTPGLFVALLKDYAIAIQRPMQKVLYQRFVTFLDTDASFDEIIPFTSDESKQKAIELYSHISSLQTPSRDNLKQKPTGSALVLEYMMDTSKMHLILNKDYASKYTFDIVANTFNLGSIKLPVNSIRVLDFKKLGEYSTGADKGTNIAGKELILLEQNVYFEIEHFTGTKQIPTMKMKDVVHTYTRVGNGRRKDKYLGAFSPKA